jgi:phospholipid/cholesterol/gamma-HCH transport system substrate-binding protein
METKANYVTVGAFTLLILLVGFALVYWVARMDTGGQTTRLDVVIEGSVTGLGVGSLVKFNGIDVGKVTGLSFDELNPRTVIARTVVSRNLPISSETKAVLGFTGLTGIAHIELEGGSIDRPNIFQLAEEQGIVATIEADPSAVNNLLATAQDIFDRTDRVLTELEGFVSEARKPLATTLDNAAVFSEALKDNAENIDKFLEGIGGVGEALADVSGKLDGTLKGIEQLLAAVDPDKVSSIVDNVDVFTADMRDVSAQIQGVADSVSKVVADLEGVGTRIDGTFDKVDSLLDAVPPDQVATAVEDLSIAGKSARTSLAEIETLTEGLGERQEDIQTIISNTQEMAERLNAASERVDGILAKADGLLGADEGEGLMAEARTTLRSFREAAETLNARINSVSSGLERFSDRGLRDVQALVNETRRSVARIEQAISDLEKNPQRLIFGGDGGVKTYDGRERR